MVLPQSQTLRTPCGFRSLGLDGFTSHLSPQSPRGRGVLNQNHFSDVLLPQAV